MTAHADSLFLSGVITGLAIVLGYFGLKRFVQHYLSRRKSSEKDNVNGITTTQAVDTRYQWLSDKKEKQDNFVTKEDGSSSKKDSEEKELTVREKFYLFLEKGFCPELEKGVDDPMYKYTGGQNREELCNQLDAQQAFCPFMGMPNEDDGLSDEAEIAAQMGRDVDEVERLMQKDIAENGKLTGCPYSKMTKGACPYSKGEQETHYDSEDEEESAADVPKSHHGGKQPPQATLAGEAISTDTDDSEDEVSTPKKLKNPSVMKAMEEVQSAMTDEEREAEAKIREAQLEAILALMEGHQEKLGLNNPQDIKSQLHLYMKQ